MPIYSTKIKFGDHGPRARERHLELRDELRHLLEHWKPFLYGRHVIRSYVNLLRRSGDEIHKTESDVLVDLGILKELLLKLEKELAESKKGSLHQQLLAVYAHRKKSMMLRELHNILGKEPDIPDDFREWIKGQLVDAVWGTELRCTGGREEDLMKRAFVDEVQLKKETINVESFDAGNPDLVKDRFLTYMKEFADVISKTNVISFACDDIPKMYQSVEELVRSLEARQTVLANSGTLSNQS